MDCGSLYRVFGQISPKMKSREFSIFIIFLMHLHVLVVCRKFELNLIKNEFLKLAQHVFARG